MMQANSKRLLITGSSGWLGRFLCPLARLAGHDPVGLDIAPGTHTDVIGSFADAAIVDQVFADYAIDAVIHGGGLHKPDIARFSKQAFIDTNVTGTLNLLQAAVDAGHDRFLMTSTTSLMISQAIRDEISDAAVWLNEQHAPLEPRNIYGVSKLAAEHLCRQFFIEYGLNALVLRTSRFFPEDDDTHRALSGQNMKANELLYRRLTVEDAARAHLHALQIAPELGFDIALISAPTPFRRAQAKALKRDASAVVAAHYPQAAALYAQRGWRLPTTIGRVYDASHSQRAWGFAYETDFASVLRALECNQDLPFIHDASYAGPSHRLASG